MTTQREDQKSSVAACNKIRANTRPRHESSNAASTAREFLLHACMHQTSHGLSRRAGAQTYSTEERVFHSIILVAKWVDSLGLQCQSQIAKDLCCPNARQQLVLFAVLFARSIDS